MVSEIADNFTAMFVNFLVTYIDELQIKRSFLAKRGLFLEVTLMINILRLIEAGTLRYSFIV